MTTLLAVCQWLYDLPWVVQLEESDNLFPIIESVHVLGIGLMAGTIITVDLRVLAWFFLRSPCAGLPRLCCLIPWWGFGLMVVSGIPLFAAESVKVIYNPAFRIKLVLLALRASTQRCFTRLSIGPWTPGPRCHESARRPRVRRNVRDPVVRRDRQRRLIAVFHGH